LLHSLNFYDFVNGLQEAAMAKAKSRSISLPEDLELRLRTIALTENRTPVNVLENAVRVFTLMPAELRNLLSEASADQARGDRNFEELSRRIMFALARERFEDAAAKLSQSDGKINPDRLDADQIVMEPHGPAAA
jgi:predicted transcriptional regulator